MKKYAFIFPGQGSQVVGMGKDLYDSFPEARKIFDIADNALNYNISDICFNGPEDILKQTKNTQPAILATSLACFAAFHRECNIKPTAVAGHSLGEYGALCVSGVLSVSEAIKITGIRAALMEEAAQKTNGSMAAVIGLSEEVICDSFDELSKYGHISVANFNCPGQIVITGDKKAISKAPEVLKDKGAKRVIELAVSGAFHSELMKDAALKFRDIIQGYTFKNAYIPIYENTDAKPVTDGEELKARVVKQIYSSVWWMDTISNMIHDGIEEFIEFGPGKVLAGLNKKIDLSIKTHNIYDTESLKEVINNLKGE